MSQLVWNIVILRRVFFLKANIKIYKIDLGLGLHYSSILRVGIINSPVVKIHFNTFVNFSMALELNGSAELSKMKKFSKPKETLDNTVVVCWNALRH